MWESLRRGPLGRLSTRKSVCFAMTLFMACFALILTTSPVAHAADGSWDGNDIVYDSNFYTGPTIADGTESHGLPKGSKVFGYIEPSMGTQKAHLIYFAPGADPPNETSAKYVEYDFQSPTTYSNPSARKTISLEKQSASSGSTKSTSCAVDGIGWIVCPVSNSIAKGVDAIYGLVEKFLRVEPLGFNTDNPLYNTWSIMRNIANVAFIGAFLVIIYSQVTNSGMSNYSLKRLIPRLIIAIVLVNVSYVICAALVDISNIAGTSIQDLLKDIRGTVAPGSGPPKWQEIIGAILVGGTAVGGVAIGAAFAGGIGALLWMAVPVLVAALLSVLVAVLILAARHAIITMLIVIAPLAFVAYLLPNTQRWYDKWQSIFLTLLMLYPMIGFVFGASQLASSVVMNSAGHDIVIIFLALAIQFIPLIITPLLLRLGGGVLNRFAGIVNNPNKGLLDRTRNMSKERVGNARAARMRQTREMMETGTLRRRNVPRRFNMHLQDSRWDREGRKNADEAYAKGMYSQRAEARDIIARLERAKFEQSIGDTAGQTLWQQQAATQPILRQKRLQQHGSAQLGEAFKKRLESEMAEADAGSNTYAPGTPMYNLTQDAHEAARQLAIQGMRLKSAQTQQQADIAQALRADAALRDIAGGIAFNGADSALASAIATERQAYGKSIGEAREIVKHFNLSDAQKQAHALGRTVTATDANGNTRDFQATNIFTREAVIEDQIKNGSVENINEIVRLSGSTLAGFATSISSAIESGSANARTAYLGAQVVDEIAQGGVTTPDRFTGILQEAIAKGNFSAERLATIDKDALVEILNAARNPDTSHMDPTRVAALPGRIAELKAAAHTALNDPILSTKVAKTRAALEDIERL